jgi:hypothetical protein
VDGVPASPGPVVYDRLIRSLSVRSRHRAKQLTNKRDVGRLAEFIPGLAMVRLAAPHLLIRNSAPLEGRFGM